MWILTTIGFFSVVAAPDDPERLLVRCRVRADLEALRDRYLAELEIVEGAGTDYRYRAFVARADFAPVAAKLAADIDYSNFKNAVAERQGHSRPRLLRCVVGAPRVARWLSQRGLWRCSDFSGSDATRSAGEPSRAMSSRGSTIHGPRGFEGRNASPA